MYIYVLCSLRVTFLFVLLFSFSFLLLFIYPYVFYSHLFSFCSVLAARNSLLSSFNHRQIDGSEKLFLVLKENIKRFFIMGERSFLHRIVLPLSVFPSSLLFFVLFKTKHKPFIGRNLQKKVFPNEHSVIVFSDDDFFLYNTAKVKTKFP